MQMSLKGMLIWAFIKQTALPDFPRVCLVHLSSAGHLQVGARYGGPSYVTSKLKDCRRMSRHCLLLVEYLLMVDLTVIVALQKKYKTKK